MQERAAGHCPSYLDLLDPATLGAAAATVLERWGRVDVLVNNGRYVGPGHMDRFLDTPVELLDRQLQANVMAPITLTKLVLPQMVARARVSSSTWRRRRGPWTRRRRPGQGGWGLGYGMSKAALHRMAGILALELGAGGIRAYNLSPGSSPPSASPSTWVPSASTPPPGPRPTWSGRSPRGW